MLVLIFIALAVIGMSQNISWGETCKDENPSFLTFMGGLSACVAMIATVITVYSETQLTVLAVIGLIGTVAFNIVPIKTGLDYQAKAKNVKDISFFTKFKLGPVWLWFRHTLVGIGKCTKIVMYCTLIGIFIVKGMENSERRIKAYAKQRELQQLKEELDELAEINRRQAEDRKKK